MILLKKKKKKKIDIIEIFSKIKLKRKRRISNFNKNVISIKNFHYLFLLIINSKILFILKKISIMTKNCNILFLYINYIENKFINIIKRNIKFLFNVIFIKNELKK